MEDEGAKPPCFTVGSKQKFSKVIKQEIVVDEFYLDNCQILFFMVKMSLSV